MARQYSNMWIKKIRQIAFYLLLIVASSLITITTSARELKLLALGDSLVAGYGLPKTDGFTDQLEATLNGLGIRVSVINSGVSGDTSAGGLSRVEWALASKPDAVLLELGANDSLRGIDPKVTKDNLHNILTKIKATGIPVLFVGMLAPPNMGKEYGLEFKSVYAELSKKHDVIFYPFFLDGVAGMPELNQADGIHPNKRGVVKIVNKISPYVRALLMNVKR